jgi:REP element-mobilizing transposase RayT
MIDTNATGYIRVVHFVVLSRHLHMIVEAKSREAMSRGMQGFGIRLAKRLNKATERKGKVFADRYHEHILKTPREVRNALCYVLRNQARHEIERDTAGGMPGVDIFSSGRYFDGWRNYRGKPLEGADPPVAPARTWLLSKGWRRCGLIGIEEIPAHAWQS